ncbi:T9SS type A sorting domain-containing protein [candidate division KSB1 bacterium]|nr:T9SS type A sorting domain-containing protein [candidate division KSB1 bacterium]
MIEALTSAEQNPLHSYQTPGTYSVSLTAFNFNVQNQKIKQDYINVQEATSLKNDVANIPHEVHLSQNYPNPFNALTRINYTLANKSTVKLSVFDISGRVVTTLVSQVQNTGKYSVFFDASDLSSGTGIYKLKTGSFEQNRRMILLR